ncbi:MAG TPA: hypothetical protein VHA82_10660 [Ramlibacter sp.]|uniref:hypothetical protein n=1 Tax=Ramlibacter sp. TaxID=1917967 RepID=UPI002CB6A9B0|nr:hypothetical protein [Ramlibacter sp.]HVZ44259.1 hypothetical protein [Ramlibacter sp.]
MFRLLAALPAAILAAILVAGCGGGDSATASGPAANAAAANATAANPAAATALPQALVDAVRQAIPPRRAAVAGAPLSPAEAFDWAELHFPEFFPQEGKVQVVQSAYAFRYYPQSGNYLAVAVASNEIALFALGPATGGRVVQLGSLADFTCVMKPGVCFVGADVDSVSMSTYEGGMQHATLDAAVPPTQGTLSVSVDEGAPWLSAELTGTSTVSITASAASLAAGNYQGGVTLQFVPIRGATTTKSVPVLFTVGPGLIAPASQAKTLNATATVASLAGSVSVARADGTAQTWMASSSQPWLQVTPSGTTPSALTYTFDANAVASLANYSIQAATVTLTSPGASTASFQVTLTKRLPYLDTAMPYGVPAGSLSHVVVHGAGFLQYASTPSISGVAASSVQVQSDSQLAFDATPPAAGNYTLAIGNAASMATATATLQVTASTPYAVTTSFAVAGNRSSYLEDPVRGAIFAVGTAENAVYRYQYNGGGWTQTALPLASPLALGMSPDGSRLFVVLAGLVKEVNPDTMQQVATLTPGLTFASNLGEPLATTVDGRLWLPAGLRYFEPRTNRFLSLDANGIGTIDGFVASADGETMLLLQDDSAHQYNASDGTVTQPMGDLELASGVRISSDGSRVLTQGSFSVYDSSFDGGYELVARLPDPAAGEHWGAAALSADGTKVAVLAYTGTALPFSFKRIDVFSTTALVPGTTTMTKTGSIAIGTAAAQCGAADAGCSAQGTLFIARDGRTVFWIGNKFLQTYKLP